jgi:hypothetical protein
MKLTMPAVLLLSLAAPSASTWAKDKPTITIEIVNSRAWTRDVATQHSGSSTSNTNCDTNGTINDSSVNATTNCTTRTTNNPAYTSHTYISQESVRGILPGGQHVLLWCQNGFRKCFGLAAGTYQGEVDGDKAVRLYVYSLTTHKLMGKVKYRIVGSW